MKSLERFCRYYDLETKDKKEVQKLGGKLKKKLLNEKYIRGITDANVDEIANAMNGEGDTKSIIYDSGEFDILYLEVSSKKDSFFKPRTYELELVVKATPQEIINLQEYLKFSKISVNETKNVTKAIASICLYHSYKDIKVFSELLENLAETKFRKIRGEFKYSTDSSSMGVFSGDVEEILNLRKIMIKMVKSADVEVAGTSISFQKS